MKSALLTLKKQFEIVDAPVPVIKQGEVLIAIKSVGVCASDVHYYVDGRIGDQVCTAPQVLGHECAGVIAQAPKSSPWHEGDRVAVEPSLPCMRCEHCKTRHFNLCSQVKFLGMPGLPGAFQEFLALSETQVHKIPDAMSFSSAAILEPLGVGYHAVNLAKIKPGETVAIFGAGAVGLLTLAVAKAHGAGKIIVFDRNDYRLDVAKKHYQADYGANVNECDPLVFIARHTGGRGVDIAFEAAGQPEAFEWTLEAPRAGGRAIIIGIPAQDRISFNAHSLRRRELLVQNVRRSNVGVDECINLAAQENFAIDNLATHHFPLEKITEAFDVAAGYKDGVIRAMITF